MPTLKSTTFTLAPRGPGARGSHRNASLWGGLGMAAGFASAVAGLAVAVFSLQADAGSRLAPQPAPALRLAVEGHPGTFQTLESLAGRVVLLNFWATWCVPCRREFPVLEALSKELAPAGLTVLAINVEDAEANAEIAAFLKQAHPSFPVLRDMDMAVARAYRIPGMPAVMLVDRQGQLRWQHAGYEPGDEKQYREQVSRLLAEPASPTAPPASARP